MAYSKPNNIVPDATTAYLKSVSNFATLSREEEVELLTLAQQGNKQARDKLIEHNLKLVISIAKKFKKNTTMSFLDIIEEGTLGLFTAIDEFDLNQGVRFSTYATQWIRQKISRGLSNYSNTIRIPAHKYELLRRIRKTEDKLKKDLLRDPSPQEIADVLNVSKQDILELLPLSSGCYSLESALGDDDGVLSDIIADLHAPAPEKELYHKDQGKVIADVLDTLNEKEKMVINLRFGLQDNKPLSLEEVGTQLSVTKERVRQIEESALRKLRQPARASVLRSVMY